MILAGYKNVGKSSLISRFCDDIFDENMMDTIGVAFKRKKMSIEIDQHKISLELNIWDFGGEEKYRALFPSYAHGTAGALILFDTTNKESLKDIDNWVKIIEENAKDSVVKLIIATKNDLKEQREVSKVEATKFCKKFKWCSDIISTSSKTGEKVEDAFISLAKEIVERNLQRCPTCGEVFNKNLKFCQYCGTKAEIETVPL